MTNQSTRDAIAGVLGWTKHSRPFSFTSDEDQAWGQENFPHTIIVSGGVVSWWEHPDFPGEKRQVDCPVMNTLDAIASLWRENLAGWEWGRGVDEQHSTWWADKWDWTTKNKLATIMIDDTGDEKADCLALLLAALKVEKKQ